MKWRVEEHGPGATVYAEAEGEQVSVTFAELDTTKLADPTRFMQVVCSILSLQLQAKLSTGSVVAAQ